MYEIVRYSNYLNNVNLKDFTAMDLNLFFSIIAKVKEQGTDAVTFTFDELKTLIDYKSTSIKRFVADLLRMNEKLLRIAGRHDIDDTTIVQFNLFSDFKTDVAKRTLTVRINKDFSFVFNDLDGQYTSFHLRGFLSLKSRYTKLLFCQLKQWKSIGRKSFTIEELRKVLDVPVSYPNRKIGTILEGSVKDLIENECFKGLKYTPVKSKMQGRAIIGYTFTWKGSRLYRDSKHKAATSGKKPRATSFNGWMVPEDL